MSDCELCDEPAVKRCEVGMDRGVAWWNYCETHYNFAKREYYVMQERDINDN